MCRKRKIDKNRSVQHFEEKYKIFETMFYIPYDINYMHVKSRR